MEGRDGPDEATLEEDSARGSARGSRRLSWQSNQCGEQRRALPTPQRLPGVMQLLPSMQSSDAPARDWQSRATKPAPTIRHRQPDLRFRCTAVHNLITNQVFDTFCSFAIITNAVTMGVAVNWSVEHYWEDQMPTPFVVLDRAFTSWFVIELLLRIVGSGCSFFRSQDWGWNIFDFVVVIVDVATNAIQIMTENSLRNGSGNEYSTVRIFRVLRLTRAFRVVRLFRFFRELRMMVFSVLRCGMPLVWSMALFFMDVFLFAMLLTQTVTTYLKDGVGDPESREVVVYYFGTMPSAFVTLFMTVSGGVSWVELYRPLTDVHWASAAVLVFFIFFTIYALTNIITGIFVDTAIQSAQNDRDEVIQSELLQAEGVLQQMREVFGDADTDGDGEITFEELNSHLNDEHVRAHLAALGLQLEEARGLFRLLDTDKSGSLSVEEFLLGCMRLKGTARSIDLATLKYESRKMHTTLRTLFAFVVEEFWKVSEKVGQADDARELPRSRASSVCIMPPLVDAPALEHGEEDCGSGCDSLDNADAEGDEGAGGVPPSQVRSSKGPGHGRAAGEVVNL